MISEYWSQTTILQMERLRSCAIASQSGMTYICYRGASVDWAYAYAAGKAGPGIPFIKPPYGADPSAQANVPAGVSAACH